MCLSAVSFLKLRTLKNLVMKKLIIYPATILMLMFSVTLRAQDKNKTAMTTMRSIKKSETKAERKEIRKEDRNLVSDMSINAFIDDFGNIPNVAWEKESPFDVAIYHKNGVEHKAFYDYNSKLVGTTTDEKFADLPKNAQNKIKKEYSTYKVDRVVFFKDNEANDTNMLLYGTEFESADNYFVEMSNKGKNIIIQVNPEGQTFFFEELRNKV